MYNKMKLSSNFFLITTLYFSFSTSSILESTLPTNQAFNLSYGQESDFIENYLTGYSYCLADPPKVSTYEPLKDSTLVSVQAFVRHGDRSPLYYNKNDGDIWDFCNKSDIVPLLRPVKTAEVPDSFSDASNGTLVDIAVQTLCFPGDLTKKGAEDSFNLGSAIREIYVDKLGFLSNSLENTNQIRVRTSIAIRTIRTAAYILSGLYPVGGPDSNVTVHSFHYPFTKENMYANSLLCPRVANLTNSLVASPDFQEYLGLNKTAITLLNSMIDGNTSSSVDFTQTRSYYFDTLSTRICHNLPAPCNSDGECAGKDVYNSMFVGANWEPLFQKRFSKYSQQYDLITAGLFLSDIKKDLEFLVQSNLKKKKCGQKESQKFLMYSVHDLTFAFLANSLLADRQNSLISPFSSHMFLEVWKSNSNANNLSVRIMLNNRILKVVGLDGSDQPWCDFNSCDYNKFIKFLNSKIPSNSTAECMA
ncbi:Counting factor 60 [Smittium mucronatum]|uniref:Counting factor 60 n=1 Tax=Smittium mucronatum TaxID=133383 RepID=A0A1R0GT44_9FUNG|nr:Counting factor 60 [Smittium mucronatum]